VALPRDESGVQRLGKSWVLFRIADAVVGMIAGECALTERQTIPARVFKFGSELLH